MSECRMNSVERFLAALIVVAFGVLAMSTPVSAIVISEIMYHSSAADDRPDEYIEIYNENIDPFDLSGYSLCGAVDLVFPRGTYLDGKTYLVVCADEAAIRAKYGIDNTIGDYVGSLGNGGERVEVCNTGGRVVVDVRYDDRGQWPVGADGTGHSLELRGPFLEIDDADSWRLSEDRGGTPGEPNGPAFESGGNIEPPSNGMDTQGFILTWLMLGPYTGSACNLSNNVIRADWLTEGSNGSQRQTSSIWEDGQVVRTRYSSARSTGLHNNATGALPTVEEYVSFSDTINLNDNVWAPNPENVMSYSFVYVDNVTGSNLVVDIGCASDDAIAIMVNGSHVWVNDACRGVGGAGQIQDTAQDVTLEPGKNLIAVKCFENGGGWSFRLRFQRRNSSTPITSTSQIQVTTDVNAGMDFDGGGDPIEDPEGEGPPDGGGEPGAEPGDSPVLINEALLWTSGERWIELHNRTGSAVNISGMYLTNEPGDLTRFEIPGGTTIPAGSHVSFTEDNLGMDLATAPPGEPGDRLFLALVDSTGERVLDAYNFEPEFEEMSEARVPDGDDEFEGASDPTRDAANRMTVNQDIVINEVMYHALDDDPDREYVELYNRGGSTVGMSGWGFTRGVNYVFPTGTALGPGEYLVVARNPEFIEQVHGLPVGSVHGPEQTDEAVGAFGALRGSGERITLKDGLGRTVDTIRIRDGGEWPRWGDGLGSSVELVDPHQDNRFGQAWDASDDSHKSEVVNLSYIGRHGGGESELHMLLLTRGITVVDNVSIIGGAVRNNDVPLIDDDEVWRFFRGTRAPPAAWDEPDFNDAGWEEGQTGIGYGDGDDATVLDDMAGSYVTVFCRKEFTVADVDDIDELVLSVTIDDGFYAYINGQQVASHNVNDRAWNASAASAGEPNLQERTLNVNTLRNGRNVLAVQVHNAGTGSSDLSFIPRLVSRTTEITNGSEQVTNGHFNSNDNGWIIEGTHVRTGRTRIDPIEGAGSLKIVASGRGDNKVNRIETPEPNGFGLSNLNTGEDLQISFDARWVVGSQTILTHGYEHAMAKSHRLAVPENLGTPGRVNSVTQRLIDESGSSNLGPVITDVWQDPPVPGANENVTVYARIADSDGVQSANIRYSANNPSSSPSTRTMSEVSPGIYRGTIPGRSLGTKIVFYVTAEDAGGRDGRYPVDIAERTHPLVLDPSRAGLGDHRYLVYQHDQELPSTPFHSYRFWMTDADLSRLESRRRQSNDLINGSFVYGGSRIYYEAKTRFSGSPFARGGIGGSYRVAMSRQEPLHGRIRKMNLDNHHGNGLTVNERFSHYLIRNNQGAISVPFSEVLTMARWQINSRVNNTLEHSWVPDVQYIGLWFDDDDGDLYEVDDRFVIDDNGGRRGNTNAHVLFPPSSPRGDGNGENKENYRWFFGLRAKNGEDDFQSLIDFARVLDPGSTSAANFGERIWDICNVEEMLRIWAVRLNTADWDTWGANRGKNCYLYRPPEDGRFNLLAWDMELTYGDVNSFLIPSNPNSDFNPGGFSEVNRMFDNVKVKKMWYGILDEMVNGPDRWFHSSYLAPFATRLAAIGMSNTGIGQPGGFIDRRSNLLRSRIATVSGTAFRITTNSGRNFSSDEFTVDIAGQGEAAVCTVLVNGESYETTYPSLTVWRVNDIPLHPGANTLELIGLDLRGGISGTDTIVVTNTNVEWDPPVLTDLDPPAQLAGETVRIRGSGFHDGVDVRFGTVESPNVTYDEFGPIPDTIIAEVPDGAGQVDVKVVNIDGNESNTLPFTYVLPPAEFLRGDVNLDGHIDISDPTTIVFHLFQGRMLGCDDAADIDDNEVLNISDAIILLDHMYRDGPSPGAPYPDTGPDPAGDALDCEG